MSLRIIKPGMSTTLQDTGRRGFQAAGVPVSGAMDMDSMRLANLLCGNNPGEAVLETTLHGAEWLMEEEQLIACTGSGSVLFINNQPAPFYKPIWVKASSLISLKPTPYGCRTYLAVAGGFKAKTELNSKSTYLPAAIGGFNGRAIKSGDLIEWNKKRTELSLRIIDSLHFYNRDFVTAQWGIDDRKIKGNEEKHVRIIKGPEWDWFPVGVRDSIFIESVSISNQSNRIGYRLNSHLFTVSPKRELISTAVSAGTIQVTHEGALIMLMADAQTTGGYPRLAQVAAVDLPLCAQLRPGSRFHFREISMDKAEELYLEKEKWFRQVRTSVLLKFQA
jgi:antagonist of KipI